MSTIRRSWQEQYQLIMECRSSGLTDYQWCKQNGIRPGTFYNWVSRLRKKACDIPDSVSKAGTVPVPHQDVVRLEIAHNEPIEVLSEPAITGTAAFTAEPAPVVIRLRDASISLYNSVDPVLLERILRLVGGSC